jgi:hypothetical protein
MSVQVRAFAEDDRPWAIDRMRERWGSEVVVVRGKARDASLLEGFVAEIDGEPTGLATFETRGAECELVTLDSLQEGIGVGSANDNVRALGFYQRRGFVLIAFRKSAVEKSRRIKPEIPELGFDDIPIRDELELVLNLRKSRA